MLEHKYVNYSYNDKLIIFNNKDAPNGIYQVKDNLSGSSLRVKNPCDDVAQTFAINTETDEVYLFKKYAAYKNKSSNYSYY